MGATGAVYPRKSAGHTAHKDAPRPGGTAGSRDRRAVTGERNGGHPRVETRGTLPRRKPMP